MFLELKTIWKTPDRDEDLQFQDEICQNMARRSRLSFLRFFSRPRLPSSIPAASDDVDSKWPRRRVGILFRKAEHAWIFLVLIEPGPPDLTFTFDVGGNAIKTGTAGQGQREQTLPDVINYITMGLTKTGPKFLEQIFLDVLWGWAEFLAAIVSDIVEVPPQRLR